MILQKRASICFSLSSKYIAKEEGVSPCGVFGVASILATPSGNWIFLSAIFLTKHLRFAFGATASLLSSFISLDCMFLSKSISWSAIVSAGLPGFNCGTRNCILSQWAKVDLYTLSLDCPLFVFFVFLISLPSWARKLLILLFVLLNV